MLRQLMANPAGLLVILNEYVFFQLSEACSFSSSCKLSIFQPYFVAKGGAILFFKFSLELLFDSFRLFVLHEFELELSNTQN